MSLSRELLHSNYRINVIGYRVANIQNHFVQYKISIYLHLDLYLNGGISVKGSTIDVNKI